jgi:hypothetical protein
VGLVERLEVDEAFGGFSSDSLEVGDELTGKLWRIIEKIEEKSCLLGSG